MLKLIFIKIYIILFLNLFSCSDGDELSFTIKESDLIENIYHDGLKRQYILYVPKSYDGSSKVPLMLNFHGYGMTASNYMEYADMRSLAETENFILIYPQGTMLNGFPHWNAGLKSTDNKSSVDDFGFIESLINKISSNYNLDLNRIYSAGYSNGAFFTYALACYHSNKIAAIGSVAGTMLQETYNNCSPTHPTAMINIHGTSDSTIPYSGIENIYLSIDDILDYWIEFNNTDNTATSNTTNYNGLTIEHYTYTNGNNSTSVEHYKIIEGQHVWFDIKYDGNNTSKIIWNFVSKYDLNGLKQ